MIRVSCAENPLAQGSVLCTWWREEVEVNFPPEGALVCQLQVRVALLCSRQTSPVLTHPPRREGDSAPLS